MQNWLGHASLQNTVRYAKLAPGWLDHVKAPDRKPPRSPQDHLGVRSPSRPVPQDYCRVTTQRRLVVELMYL